MNGFLVKVKWTNGRKDEYHNVTEVHYGYESVVEKIVGEVRIAFESDIHGTGSSFSFSDISEMRITPEEKVNVCF